MGQAGSFEASDMARWFPQLLASMQKQGITGMDAVTQLGAMLQVQMKTAGTSDEAANNLKNWMEKIGSGEVVDAYKKAGIDYQGSLNTGIQGGMSTLEASFGLAKRYIEAPDPKKAAKMAEATAQISKEANPEKAKAMLSSLEQALRTGDIFADMQVKSALTAYVQNKALYEQLKNEAAGASGILDKNLSERRDTSSQKWAETIQAGNDAMRSVGDAIRPVTDAVATGLTTVVKGITKLSDESPKLVMGLTALATGASVVTSLLGALKIGRGLVNLARGGLGGGGGAGRAGVQSVFVTNAKDALGGGDDDGDGKGDAVKSLVSAGLNALMGRKDEAGEGDGAADTKLDPVETGLKLLDVIREAKGGDDEAGPDHTQKVFVVNAREIGGGGPGGGGRGGRRSRRRGPPRPPAPPPVPPRLGARLMNAVGTISKAGKAIPAGSLFEAGIKAFDTYTTAKTAEEKAEGYGGAAGGLAGTMAGAAAGAAIGSVVPIIGTAMGGLVGAFLGGMGGDTVGGMFGKTSFAKSLFGSDAEPGDVVRSMSAQSGRSQTPSPLVLKSESKPAPIDQKFTFAPHMPITIEGDVKDPDELMRKLQPMMQGHLNDFARQMEDNARRANDRKLYDAPHIG